MTPISLVIVGAPPMYNSLDEIDIQINNMENYKRRLLLLKLNQFLSSEKLVWDEIDSEISPLSETQKQLLLNNDEYSEIYFKILELVQVELLNLVKHKIEATVEGKNLLNSQLQIIKRLKKQIVDETNKEMELFKKFKEFSKLNPGITYEEFLKSNF